MYRSRISGVTLLFYFADITVLFVTTNGQDYICHLFMGTQTPISPHPYQYFVI